MLDTRVGRGPTRGHAAGSISKFVIAYLSNQIPLEGTTIEANDIQNVPCPAVVVILALKINFLTTQAKFEGQYFSNWRCEIVKKFFLCNNFRYSVQMS